MVLIGAVIPAVFNTFGGQDIGGLFLTKVFEGYHRLVIGAIAVLGLGCWYRWWTGDPFVTVGGSELALLAGMVGIAGLIILVLHPQASALQAQAFSLQDPTEKKTALEALFRVLVPVRWLYLGNLAMGISLIVIRAKRSYGRDSATA